MDWRLVEEDDFQAARLMLLEKGNAEPAKALLLTVAKCRALNRMRDAARRPRLAKRALAAEGDLAEFIPRRLPSPAEVAEARRFLQRLAKHPEGRRIMRHFLGEATMSKNALRRDRLRLSERGLKFPADLVEEMSTKRRTQCQADATRARARYTARKGSSGTGQG